MNLLTVGIEHTLDSSERRNIKLANFMSLLMATAMMMIVGFRAGMGVLKGWFFVPMVLEAIVILALIVLTALGRNVVSRILLCWIPAIFLIVDFRIVLLHSGPPETSHYVGFRIFQLSFGCFPLLLFNTNHWKRVAIGLSVPLA